MGATEQMISPGPGDRMRQGDLLQSAGNGRHRQELPLHTQAQNEAPTGLVPGATPRGQGW